MILQVVGVSKRFGGIQALLGVSLELPEAGSGLDRLNGAGKTTCSTSLTACMRRRGRIFQART
jgi:ABC-type branched-subunit amino acid transport system ATPase component